MDPYWLDSIVGGFKNGNRYLGQIDIYGSYLEHEYVCTGFAAHLCGHIINTEWNKDCELETALATVTKCFQALFARHTLSNDNLEVVVVNKDGVRTDSQKIKVEWEYSNLYVDAVTQKASN